MFAPRYFTPRYFTARYWPPGQGIGIAGARLIFEVVNPELPVVPAPIVDQEIIQDRSKLLFDLDSETQHEDVITQVEEDPISGERNKFFVKPRSSKLKV